MNTDKHDYTTTHVSTEREREKREGERREREREEEGGKEAERGTDTERQSDRQRPQTHRTAASLLTVFTGHHGIVAILLEADVAKVKDARHQGQHRQLRFLVQPYHLHGSLHR